MTHYIKLAKNDWRIIGRDPMLLVSMIAPIFIILVAMLLFPLISDLSIQYFNFSFVEYFNFGYLFLAPVLPMLMGMVYGFMLLDERDGGIISYLAITPLGKSGYILVRMLVPIIFSFMYLMLYFHLTGIMHDRNYLFQVTIGIILASEAPMVLLFLAAFADNKVEGIAISKGFGILMLTILLDYFFKGDWRWVLMASPTCWIERAIVYPNYQLVYLIGAIFSHLIFLILLYRKFISKYG